MRKVLIFAIGIVLTTAVGFAFAVFVAYRLQLNIVAACLAVIAIIAVGAAITDAVAVRFG